MHPSDHVFAPAAEFHLRIPPPSANFPTRDSNEKNFSLPSPSISADSGREFVIARRGTAAGMIRACTHERGEDWKSEARRKTGAFVYFSRTNGVRARTRAGIWANFSLCGRPQSFHAHGSPQKLDDAFCTIRHASHSMIFARLPALVLPPLPSFDRFKGIENSLSFSSIFRSASGREEVVLVWKRIGFLIISLMTMLLGIIKLIDFINILLKNSFRILR